MLHLPYVHSGTSSISFLHIIIATNQLSPPQPCQSLFVAPCSHVWHYKCIRPILNGPSYPHFLCPNCRAVADLEADVDEPFEEWDDAGSDIANALEESRREAAAGEGAPTPRASLAIGGQSS